MSIQNVKKLIKFFEISPEFRKECFRKTPDELSAFLISEKLTFDFNQMEDSLRLHVLSAPNYSESCHLFGIYDVIRVMLDWPSFEFALPQPTSHF